LGLPTTSSSSCAEWTFVNSKISKNQAKVEISKLSVQNAAMVLTSSKSIEPSLLSPKNPDSKGSEIA